MARSVGTVLAPTVLVLLGSLLGFLSCGDDDSSEAIRRGVGSECMTSSDCTEQGQVCLAQFKGGYCGIEGCQDDGDCPQGSVCVDYTAIDGNSYCFLVCTDKPQCNQNRSEENEANCSSSVTFVEPHPGLKACVPPSGQ